MPNCLALIHPEDKKKLVRGAIQAMREQKPLSIDHRIIRQDGTIRYVHEEGKVILDRNGKPSRLIGTVLDITDRKNAEEELRALSHRLVQIQENERQEIARELHDEIGQTLTVLKLLLEERSMLLRNQPNTTSQRHKNWPTS